MTDSDKETPVEPIDAFAILNRGLAFASGAQYDSAIKDYEEAIRLNPNLAEAFAARGAAYGDIGQYDRAIQDLRESRRPKFESAQSFRPKR